MEPGLRRYYVERSVRSVIARRIGYHRGEMAFGREVFAQHRTAFELADVPLCLKDRDVEVEQNAGFDGLAELHPVDAHEIDELARTAEAERFDRENAAGLRQCLDDEDAGHDRPAGEKIGRAHV